MLLTVNEKIQLKPIDKENAAILFPLFKADLKEISRWFPFDENYQLKYDFSYIDEKEPPFDETFVIYYKTKPCGRVGLYDYDKNKKEIFLYYWVASPYRRKHIAIDSVNTVLDYLKNLEIKTVLFDVKKENKNSILLINKIPNTSIVSEDTDILIYSHSIL